MIKDRFEIWVSESGNVSVYRGSAFIRTEELTEEEKEFIIDRIANELGVNTKGDRETFAEHYGCISETDNNLKEVAVTRDSALEDEIKRYTEEKYHETFGSGQRTYDEFDWEDIAVTIEETAVHFAGWKEKAPEYKTISKILSLGFMHYLDDNRQEGKMCLSNAECEDITKAVSEQDWIKLERYAEKYVGGCGNKHRNDEPNCDSV